MNQIQVISIVFLLISICYSTIDAQNPFPQTSIYESLDIRAIIRNSSSTARSVPGMSTDLSFELNNKGYITKKTTFPGGKFERESFKFYKADTLIIEEEKWGLRKKTLQSQKKFKYDDLDRLIEEVYYVSGKLRSTKKYSYNEDSKQLNFITESIKRNLDTCYYYYTDMLLDSIGCIQYSEGFNELVDSLQININHKTTTFIYDQEGRLIQENENSSNGNQMVKKYSFPTLESSGILKSKEVIKNYGRSLSITEYEYDEHERIVSSIEKYTFPPHSDRVTTYK